MKRFFVWLILCYLRFWAHVALTIHRPKIIGITGSVGKSSCRNAIYAAIKNSFCTKMIEKGNSETGIPLGIVGRELHDYSLLDWLCVVTRAPCGIFNLRNTDVLIVEMGVDEPTPPKNMQHLLTIVKPDIAVLLNVYPVHTMQFEKILDARDIHKTDEEKRSKILTTLACEKGKIITQSGCKTAIYNTDSPYMREILNTMKKQPKNLFSFGTSHDNTLFFKNYRVRLDGTSFTFAGNNTVELFFKKYLLPKAYQEIFAATLLVGLSLGIDISKIKTHLEDNFTLPAGRSTLLPGIKNTSIIDSSYNASRASTLAMLELVENLKQQTGKQIVLIYGDMRELGELAREEHQIVAEKIITIVDYLCCVGPLTKKYVIPFIEKHAGIVKKSVWMESAKKAGKWVAEKTPHNSIILVKGSQNTIFLEEAIKPLLRDEEDVSHLCRQESYWMSKKEIYQTTSS
ncbi:MAG TPA: hypothetical protein VJH96_04250 [Patescibacteria group bacterium]|nr:hypothetical protein [Patescibacteria group bacterium]